MSTSQITLIQPTEIYVSGNSQYSTDVLLNMWLHGKSASTQKAYGRVANKFLAFTGCSLDSVGLIHLQQFSDSLGNLAKNSQKTYICIVKSLISFLHNLGLTRANCGKALKAPKASEALNERILSAEEVAKMIESEVSDRNRLMLKVLYFLGLRAEELAGLQWKDSIARKSGGQVTVTGKGSKVRTVLIPQALWVELEVNRGGNDDYMFISRKGGKLNRTAIWRVVKAAATRIGIKNASPHWLRHSHASHSLDNGCQIHLLSASLGHASVSTTSRYLHARPDESSSLFLAV